MSKKPKKRMRRERERAALEAEAAERERIAQTISTEAVEDGQVRGGVMFGIARRAFEYAFIALTAALLMTLSVSVGRAVLASQVSSGAIETVDSVLWSVAIGAGAMGGMFAMAPHMSRAMKSLFDMMLRRSAGRRAESSREAAGGTPEKQGKARALGHALAGAAGILVAAALTAIAAIATEALALLVSIGLTYAALGSTASGSWDVMLFMSASAGISAGGAVAMLPHVWRCLMRAGAWLFSLPARVRARKETRRGAPAEVAVDLEDKPAASPVA